MLVVVPIRDLVVLHAVDHVAQLFQADRRAIAVGHDQRPVERGARELAIGLQRERLVRAVQRAVGQVHVGVLDRGCSLHRFRSAARPAPADRAECAPHISASRNTCTCATPLTIEMRCAEQRLGVLIHGVERQRVRTQRHDTEMGWSAGFTLL